MMRSSGNHYGWSIDGVEDAWPTHGDHVFSSRHGKVAPNEVQDFRTEINLTVQEIHAVTAELPIVTFSGGIDGEIILRGFMDCGYPVTALTYVYPHGINEYELYYARDFCRRAGLKHVEIPMDIMEFYDARLGDYCDRYRLPHWMCTWKAWLFDNFQGFMIQAQGWPQLALTNDGLRVKEDSHHMDPLVVMGRQGISDFFKYRPQLTWAWLTDSDIQRWCGDLGRPFEALAAETHFKYFALSKYYNRDSVAMLPREKKTGVELISPYVTKKMAPWQKKYGDRVKTVSWTYGEYLQKISL